MPKRSNEFQRLIFRLQAALHDSGCKIEESALVRNYVSGKDDEIDVLVTFRKGDCVYRTGIACRDHSRPAGPGWIRDLAGQRRQCRLDKVIAFHSKGFTDSARLVAADENIGVYKTDQIDDLDIRTALGHLMSVLVSVRLHQHVTVTPIEESLPADFESGLAAIVIDGTEVQCDSFRITCNALITEWCHNQICSGGTVTQLPKAYSQTSLVEYSAFLPDASQALLRSGQRFSIVAFSGIATVQHTLRYMFGTTPLRIGESDVLDLEWNVYGRGVQALYVKSGDHRALHLEARPGSDLTLTSFTRERKPVENPFPLFEVKWRPESTMISGPHNA